MKLMMMGLSLHMSEETAKVIEHGESVMHLGRRKTLNTPKSPVYLPHGWLKATRGLIKLKPAVRRSVEKRHGHKKIARKQGKREKKHFSDEARKIVR